MSYGRLPTTYVAFEMTIDGARKVVSELNMVSVPRIGDTVDVSGALCGFVKGDPGPTEGTVTRVTWYRDGTARVTLA